MPSLKLISATDTQYSATVLKSMNDQRTNGLFCDVTIIIRDKKFRAHKTILSASSSYFHQLFRVAGQVIELNFIRAEIFEQILNYMYSSKIVRVRSDMMEELINAGQILGVKFIANLATPLSQVKGLSGLSKEETENKSDVSVEVMPIITDTFSISAEEFNQSSRPVENTEESDNDVMFVSQTGPQVVRKKPKSKEITNSKVADAEKASQDPKVQLNDTVPVQCDNLKPCLPESSVDTSNLLPSTKVLSDTHSASLARSSSVTPESPSVSQSSENNGMAVVHQKHVSTSPGTGDVKIRLLDVSENAADAEKNSISAVTTKKTVTLNMGTEIDLISSGCKVYANIGENTYDIVSERDDPGEGGSKVGKAKRSQLMKNPDETLPSPLSSPNKKSKTDPEDHYKLVMDGKTFFVCSICQRPYVSLPSLRRHFNIHSWKRKYPCRHCDKVFALAEYRTKHEILHTGERRYQCLLCNEMFINYQLLSNHCKAVHNQDPSGRKQKDDKDLLYQLLPCKTVPRKTYSWEENRNHGVSMISEDGSVQHVITTTADFDCSVRPGLVEWDKLFSEPDTQTSTSDGRASSDMPPEGNNEFDFVIPDTY